MLKEVFCVHGTTAVENAVFACHIILFISFIVIYCFICQFCNINFYRFPRVKMKYIHNFNLNSLTIKKVIF